jgi:hypothetical protein
MKWVAWKNIGVDRMACAWLITRWIDPKAEFIFVPAGTKALPKGAEPFDIPGARYSHHRGHCTFYSLLKAHDIKDPVLAHIARIVDEADVVQDITLEPAAVGLDLICRGIRRISTSDEDALKRSQFVYDALYAELSNSEV